MVKVKISGQQSLCRASKEQSVAGINLEEGHSCPETLMLRNWPELDCTAVMSQALLLCLAGLRKRNTFNSCEFCPFFFTKNNKHRSIPKLCHHLYSLYRRHSSWDRTPIQKNKATKCIMSLYNYNVDISTINNDISRCIRTWQPCYTSPKYDRSNRMDHPNDQQVYNWYYICKIFTSEQSHVAAGRMQTKATPTYGGSGFHIYC